MGARKNGRAWGQTLRKLNYSTKLCTIYFTPDNVATIKFGQFKGGFYSFKSEDLMADLVAKIDSKMTQKKSRGRCHQPLEEYLQTNEQNKTKKKQAVYILHCWGAGKFFEKSLHPSRSLIILSSGCLKGVKETKRRTCARRWRASNSNFCNASKIIVNNIFYW